MHKPVEGTSVFPSSYIDKHKHVKNRYKLNDYKLKVAPILSSCSCEDYIKHEMAIEAGIISQLSNKDEHTLSIFGFWDYLTHQVIASPFKPIDYMDKMDIFGYSYITGFDPTKSKYLIIEIKKDTALKEDVDQLLKYVDWVKDEYCHGDYNMISSFLVAYDFNSELIDYKKSSAIRKYIIGRRPAKSLEWSDLKFVRYIFNIEKQKLEFENYK